MSIQAVQMEFKAIFGSLPPSLIMLIGMFGGVAAGPIMLFIIGGSVQDTAGYPNLPWLFAVVSSLQLVGIGAGILMFRRESKVANDISVIPAPGLKPGLKRDEVNARPGHRVVALSLVQSNGAGSERAAIK